MIMGTIWDENCIFIMRILRVPKRREQFQVWYPLDCCSVFDSTLAPCKALEMWCDSLELIVLGYFPLFPPPNTCMWFLCWKDRSRCCLQVLVVAVACPGCFSEGIRANPHSWLCSPSPCLSWGELAACLFSGHRSSWTPWQYSACAFPPQVLEFMLYNFRIVQLNLSYCLFWGTLPIKGN